MLKLPRLKELKFKKELERYEEGRKMPYVTSNERIARQEGRREGLKEGLKEGIQKGLGLGQIEAVREAVLDVLEARFGQAAVGLREKIQGCNELVRLKSALRQAALVGSLGELEL